MAALGTVLMEIAVRAWGLHGRAAGGLENVEAIASVAHGVDERGSPTMARAVAAIGTADSATRGWTTTRSSNIGSTAFATR